MSRPRLEDRQHRAPLTGVPGKIEPPRECRPGAIEPRNRADGARPRPVRRLGPPKMRRGKAADEFLHRSGRVRRPRLVAHRDPRDHFDANASTVLYEPDDRLPADGSIIPERRSPKRERGRRVLLSLPLLLGNASAVAVGVASHAGSRQRRRFERDRRSHRALHEGLGHGAGDRVNCLPAMRRQDAADMGIAPATADEPLEATMVIGVPVRDDDRAQVTHRHLKHVEVASHGVRGEAGVVQNGSPVTVTLDGDQRAEAVLRDELLRRAEVRAW